MTTPVFRRYLPEHLATADLLSLILIAGGVLFTWMFWAAQPTCIFNMTMLGVAWEFVMMTDFLLHFRHPDSALQKGPLRIAKD
jgi:hypothetical protein